MSVVNKNIKFFRNQMGITQERLGELIEINRKVVGSYEENRAIPPLDNLNKMAKVFGVSLDQLTSHDFTESSSLFSTKAQNEISQSSLTDKEARPAQVQAQELQVTKKKPLSRTGLGGRTYGVFSENTIPYISYRYFDKYVLDDEFESRIGELPILSLPFLKGGGVFRAFDMPSDSHLDEGIIIGEKTEDLTQVNKEDFYLFVSQKKGLLLRKMNQNGQVLILNSSEEVLDKYDIKEIWKVVGYYSTSLPKNQPNLQSLAHKINLLKTEIEGLL